jgi:hypothetical protein
MNWFLKQRTRRREMGYAARESAKQYAWPVYRRRVTDFLASL